MHPELFTIPFLNFSVHSYGLMLVLGLLLGMELAKFLARRSGLNPDTFSTAAILALISGLIGARIAFVIQFHEQFSQGTFAENAWDAINLTSGGLVYYGGFLLAFPTLVAYAIWRKVPLLRGMDIVAPCLMIGLALGRVGCFLNGCCWGERCELDAPIAITFPYHSPTYLEDVADHKIEPDPRLYVSDPLSHKMHLITPKELEKRPDLQATADKERSTRVINTQLISTVTASVIAISTFLFFTLYRTPGRGFALMMVMEGLTRFLIESFRVEPEVGASALTLSMWIGLFVAIGGVALWFAAGALRHKKLIGDTPGYPQASLT